MYGPREPDPPPPQPLAPVYIPRGWYDDPGGQGRRYWTGNAWAGAVPAVVVNRQRPWVVAVKVLGIVSVLLVFGVLMAVLG